MTAEIHNVTTKTYSHERIDTLWRDIEPRIRGTEWEIITRKAMEYLKNNPVRLSVDNGTLMVAICSERDSSIEYYVTAQTCQCTGNARHKRCYHRALVRLVERLEAQSGVPPERATRHQDAYKPDTPADVLALWLADRKMWPISTTTLYADGTVFLYGTRYRLVHYADVVYRIDTENTEHIGTPVVWIDFKYPVYTFGYAGKPLTLLDNRAKELGAIVVDIRMKPYSKQPGWSDRNLSAFLTPSRYVHISEFGNVNYNNDGGIQINDMARGVARILDYLKTQPVILLCGCKDHTTCHRAVVAETLSSLINIECIHL